MLPCTFHSFTHTRHLALAHKPVAVFIYPLTKYTNIQQQAVVVVVPLVGAIVVCVIKILFRLSLRYGYEIIRWDMNRTETNRMDDIILRIACVLTTRDTCLCLCFSFVSISRFVRIAVFCKKPKEKKNTQKPTTINKFTVCFLKQKNVHDQTLSCSLYRLLLYTTTIFVDLSTWLSRFCLILIFGMWRTIHAKLFHLIRIKLWKLIFVVSPTHDLKSLSGRKQLSFASTNVVSVPQMVVKHFVLCWKWMEWNKYNFRQ